MNLEAFYSLSYGMYVISAWDAGRATGCIANCVVQVTAEPETVAVSLNHDSYTHQCITESGRFAVSVLAKDTDPALIGAFGFRSGRETNKFDAPGYEIKGHMPVLKGACAYILCDVINRMETPTHTVFLGKVTDADKMFDKEPMTYAYYRKEIRGKSPKGAPTYVPEDKVNGAKKDRYICKVCGYVYDGAVPFEELPQDYVCPLCKQPKAVFEKL